MTDKLKRPEFKLHQTPPPEPDPKFCVRKGEDGTVSIEMNGYTVLGGLSETAAKELQHTLYMVVCEPIFRSEMQAMAVAQASAMAQSRPMQELRSRSLNDLHARTTLGIFG